MIFDLKKEFEKVLKPIAGDIKYRISDAVLDTGGMIVNEQPMEIEIDWLISGDIDTPIQGKKQNPIGESNQSKIIKGVRKFYSDGIILDLEPRGIARRFNVDGVKHIFKYTIHLVDKPEKGLTEIFIPELKEKKPEEKVSKKKVIKNKFREVKEYGKNGINSN